MAVSNPSCRPGRGGGLLPHLRPGTLRGQKPGGQAKGGDSSVLCTGTAGQQVLECELVLVLSRSQLVVTWG